MTGFWGGWMVRPGGERIDLTRLRRDGASLPELAAMAMKRLPESTAATWSGEQVWLEVFRSAPEQWGLRGDPVVWDLLARHMRQQSAPENVEAGMQTLYEAIRYLTGVDLREAGLIEQVHNVAWERGGMSSGHMHCWTWRDRVMPYLRQRLELSVS